MDQFEQPSEKLLYLIDDMHRLQMIHTVEKNTLEQFIFAEHQPIFELLNKFPKTETELQLADALIELLRGPNSPTEKNENYDQKGQSLSMQRKQQSEKLLYLIDYMHRLQMIHTVEKNTLEQFVFAEHEPIFELLNKFSKTETELQLADALIELLRGPNSPTEKNEDYDQKGQSLSMQRKQQSEKLLYLIDYMHRLQMIHTVEMNTLKQFVFAEHQPIFELLNKFPKTETELQLADALIELLRGPNSPTEKNEDYDQKGQSLEELLIQRRKKRQNQNNAGGGLFKITQM